MPEKHLPFFKFIEACDQPGCPVCTQVESAEAKYFDNLCYEFVNDRGFRGIFDSVGGFCPPHAARFAETNDGLAVSICYRNFLLAADPAARRAKRSGAFFRAGREGPCQACQKIGEMETGFMAIMRGFIDDAEFIAAFERSAGLCIAHDEALRAELKKLPDWYEAHAERRWKELLAETDRYLAWCNLSSDSRPELARDEQLLWRKLIPWLYGGKGIARPRRPSPLK